MLWSTVVTPEHLATLGILLLQGRGFTPADRKGAELVVLISRATARRYWPDRNPIGRRLKPVWDKEWRTIVGVVDDVKNYSITGPPDWVDGEVYLPMAQALLTPQSVSLIVRLGGVVGDFEKRLPEMVREVCTNCAVSKIARMKTIVAGALAAPRSMSWLGL